MLDEYVDQAEALQELATTRLVVSARFFARTCTALYAPCVVWYLAKVA